MTGNIIAEYNNSGVKQKANVYIGGEILAQQIGGQVRWQHTNLVNGSGINTNSSGQTQEAMAVDPTSGINLGDSDPFSAPPGASPGEVPGFGAGQSIMGSMVAQFFPNSGGPNCVVNGLVSGCHVAGIMMNSGSGEHAPVQTLYPIYSRSQNRYVGLARWDANAAAAGVGIGTGGLHGLNRGTNVGWVWQGQTFSSQNGVGGVNMSGSWYSLGDIGQTSEYSVAYGDVKAEALLHFKAFINLSEDCAKLAQKLGLEQTLKNATLIDPTSDEKLMNKTLKELGDTSPTNTLTLKQGLEGASARTIWDTQTVYFNTTEGEGSRFGYVVFHESLHLYAKGNHVAIAKVLGLAHQAEQPRRGEVEEAKLQAAAGNKNYKMKVELQDDDPVAEKALQEFLDNKCVKK